MARFVKAEKDSGCLGLVTQHTYIGGNSKKRGIDVPHAIESMMSKDWVTNKYPELYRTVLKPVAKQGLPFRITELDDYVHGVTNGSDAFVSCSVGAGCHALVGQAWRRRRQFSKHSVAAHRHVPS